MREKRQKSERERERERERAQKDGDSQKREATGEWEQEGKGDEERWTTWLSFWDSAIEQTRREQRRGRLQMLWNLKISLQIKASTVCMCACVCVCACVCAREDERETKERPKDILIRSQWCWAACAHMAPHLSSTLNKVNQTLQGMCNSNGDAWKR